MKISPDIARLLISLLISASLVGLVLWGFLRDGRRSDDDERTNLDACAGGGGGDDARAADTGALRGSEETPT